MGPGSHLEAIVREYLTSRPKSFKQVVAQAIFKLPHQRPGGCNCGTMKDVMDVWGVETCISYRKRITDNIYLNSIRLSVFGVAKLAERDVRSQIDIWFDDAMERARNDRANPGRNTEAKSPSAVENQGDSSGNQDVQA